MATVAYIAEFKVMDISTIGPPIPIYQVEVAASEAAHDHALCPKDHTEDLWQSWGQPDIWRLPHGHVGVCCGFVPGLPGRVLRWLTPRMEMAGSPI
jgi:hypothetical protein